MGEGWGNAPHSQEYWGSGISSGVSERERRAGNVVESDGVCLFREDAIGGTVEGKAIRDEVGDGGPVGY